jgi:hypothetical protein
MWCRPVVLALHLGMGGTGAILRGRRCGATLRRNRVERPPVAIAGGRFASEVGGWRIRRRWPGAPGNGRRAGAEPDCRSDPCPTLTTYHSESDRAHPAQCRQSPVADRDPRRTVRRQLAERALIVERRTDPRIFPPNGNVGGRRCGHIPRGCEPRGTTRFTPPRGWGGSMYRELMWG